MLSCIGDILDETVRALWTEVQADRVETWLNLVFGSEVETQTGRRILFGIVLVSVLAHETSKETHNWHCCCFADLAAMA